jgi:hypothetical protein
MQTESLRDRRLNDLASVRLRPCNRRACRAIRSSVPPEGPGARASVALPPENQGAKRVMPLLFQPSPPPCGKCGTTTVLTPAFEEGQRVFAVRCPATGSGNSDINRGRAGCRLSINPAKLSASLQRSAIASEFTHSAISFRGTRNAVAMNRTSVERRRFLRGVARRGDGASRLRDRSSGNRHGRAPQCCL